MQVWIDGDRKLTPQPLADDAVIDNDGCLCGSGGAYPLGTRATGGSLVSATPEIIDKVRAIRDASDDVYRRVDLELQKGQIAAGAQAKKPTKAERIAARDAAIAAVQADDDYDDPEAVVYIGHTGKVVKTKPARVTRDT